MGKFLGAFLVIIAAIGFGFMGLFGSWATSAGVSVEMMLFLRFAIAGAVMAAIMFIGRHRWPRGRTLPGLIGMGAILYVGEAMFWFHAANYVPTGLVSLLLYIYPVIVTIFAWLVLKEPLTRGRVVALGLACAGLILTIVPLVRSDEVVANRAGTMLGIAFGLLCCLSYAIYILCGGGMTERAGAIPAATVVILSAAVVLGTFALSRGDAFPVTSSAWIGIILLATFSTVIAITAVLYGLQKIGPVQTSTLSTLEPVVTVIIGAVAMGQSLQPVQIVGGTLIIIAAVIVARSAVHGLPRHDAARGGEIH